MSSCRQEDRPIDHMLVIGAGIAGLTAAIDGAAQGARVTLLEKDDNPGGKMSAVAIGGRQIDSGPTVLTMAPVFARLFEDAGLNLAEFVTLRRADLLARHFWSGDASLDLHADLQESADAIGRFAGPRDARGFLAFSQQARKTLEFLRPTFLETERPVTPFHLLWRAGLRGLPGFLALDPYRSLAKMARDHFADPRLRQLFGRYTTYCGSSPYRAPATLALIAEVERDGVWQVDGGMAAFAQALLTACRQLGVDVRLGCEVAQIETNGGRATGVSLASGERIGADRIIHAGDRAGLVAGLFGPAVARGRRLRKNERSLSACTVAAVADADGVQLAHHNVLFSDDAAAEFASLESGAMPADPTVYLCAQDRPTPPGATGERVFLVLNAPADGDEHVYSQEERDRCMTRALSRLDRCGLQLTPRFPPSISTPSDFERRFPATGGALYGRVSHGWMASFLRPGARTAIRGLYCAGGSVHPGAGVPMAALSGRIAARASLQDRSSTSSFPKAAMLGGTSTPSARTAAIR